ADREVMQRCALVCLNPQSVKCRQEFSTGHRTGTARDPIGQCVSSAVLPLWVVGTSGRDQQRKGCRLHCGHGFNKHCQPIAECRVMDFVSCHESVLKVES